jgi:FkbM family methyltransferase
MKNLEKTKKREDVVYDVGMHKGEDSDYYLKKGFNVIGFEADPNLIAYCRSKFQNEIGTGKLIIIEGAIVELPDDRKRSRVQFYRDENSIWGWGTVCSDWAQRNELLGSSNEIIEVPVVDFNACLRKYGIPHYLKIDIEGMDTVCLKALRDFEQKPDYVSIESEKISFEKLVDELNLLKQLDYTRFKAIQQRNISRQIEPNPSKEGYYAGYHFKDGSSGLFGEDLPGDWKNYLEMVNEYKRIFLQYRLFGDYGKLRKYFLGKVLKKFLSMILRKPVPGWYDTHAKHSSVVF